MTSIINSLKLLSDPTRIRLLSILDKEDLSVAEIQDILGMGQSRISSHLALLKRTGLLHNRRVGKHIYYGINRDTTPGNPWLAIREIVLLGNQELPEAEHDNTATKLAIRRRQDTARDYFNKLAGKFGRHYCPGRTWRGLSYLLLATLPPMRIADLGAGEGTLSQLLARRAKQVIAIDNSEKMVEFGRQLIKEHGFKNLEYRLGDIEEPPIKAGSMDLAILSQALHHASHPQRAIDAAFRLLKKGGRITILDLLTHSQEEARELYADLWLGFSEVELHTMLTHAGFDNIDIAVVDKDAENPKYQVIFATAEKL